MAKPDDLVAAALFTDRAVAEEAWGRLLEADIPASVITEPGMVGAYRLNVMVERKHLDEAQRLIADLVGRVEQ
jgi:ABC-type hemin transport system ATPase subunit